MKKIKTLLQIYWSFFKIGGLTFGGGLTMLPMLERELVDKRKWITEEELLDCYAIGQCTPGIIAVNTATFVGYKKGGVAGGILGTLGMVSPSIVIITIVALFLKNFINNVWFQHAMMGIRGVVCALLMNTVINLGKKSLKSAVAWGIAIVIALLAFFTKLPTIILVLFAAAFGITYDAIKNHKKNAVTIASSDNNDAENIVEENNQSQETKNE
ncbi:MAG: chromate transporter [Treponema sp.]|nr:chromate transporter [Treponema sp.]